MAQDRNPEVLHMPTDVNNYRPISLLSTFSKIMEKLMAVRLNSYLELYEIIYPNNLSLEQVTQQLIPLLTLQKTLGKQ